MKILNEFEYTNSNEEIKKLIIQDLVAKIGWIKGNYPNKIDSSNNLDILFRHLSFEDNKEDVPISDYIWDNINEIYTEIVKLLPISKYFFGKEFPKIRWFFNKDNTITYTLC
jgi:hypothetical protein